MRIIRFASTLALLLLAAAAASAQSSAKGTYDFTLGDNNLKHVDFDCQQLSTGGVSGSMLLTDEATVVYQDTDGDGSPTEKYPGFSMSVAFDEMSVNKTQAVCGGVVRDATIPYLIGQRVLLTVEDNGTDPKNPDHLTWGLYKIIKRDWTPSDAEWDRDPGVGLTWWATDAEIPTDRGYAMPRDESINAQTFPFAAYLFVDTSDGRGDIVVNP